MVRSVSVVLMLAAGVSVLPAKRLPIRQYTTADGLPHDRINRIVSDSSGFLWFATEEGLSRFDGTEFVTYHKGPQGFDASQVSDVAEGPDGTYWIGVWRGGLARLDPAAQSRAALIRRIPGDYPDTVRRILFDGEGRLWLGTAGGLYLLEKPSDGENPEFVNLPGARPAGRPNIWQVLVDGGGTLWIATDGGQLLTRTPGGVVRVHSVKPGTQPEGVRCLLEDRKGRIWVGHDLGVTIFDPDALDEPIWHGPEIVGPGMVLHLFQSSDGAIWLSRHRYGLTRFTEGSFHLLTEADGMPFFLPKVVGEDQAGNVWIGTYDSGAYRLAPTGLTSFDREDGIGPSHHNALVETREGGIVVLAGNTLHHFTGERFEAIQPPLLQQFDYVIGTYNPALLQDRQGRWWLGTRDKLFRFAPQSVNGLATAAPEATYTVQDGLPPGTIGELFEDSQGHIWIGTDIAPGLAWWDPVSEKVHRFTQEDGLPNSHPYRIAEDAAGNVWIGMRRNLVRYRSGEFTLFDSDDGLTAYKFVTPFVDSSGRLWLLSVGAGVDRIDDPAAAKPIFRRLAPENGLPSDLVKAAVEDLQGRIYIGTSAGVLRIDPETGNTRRFTTADGLSNNEIAGALRDRSGALWFASMRGVSRLVPRAGGSTPPAPPPVRITGLKIAGLPYVIAELGEATVGGIRIPRDRSRLRIDFGSIHFGQSIHYEYRLDGPGSDWTTTQLPTVNFASVAPGSYRFEVRAVDSNGQSSETPASVAFRVLPPVWQQGWFLALVSGIVGLSIYFVYRYRMTRVVELERVRTRIATDLHDDLGASLSRISILSEVARRRIESGDRDSAALVAEIGDTSRSLVDATSDIVWSVDPRQDDLGSLIARLRKFTSDVLDGSGTAWEFASPDEPGRIGLDPERRRHLFLILKEAVNNISRHAMASRARLSIRLVDHALVAEVEDDGRGFETGTQQDGAEAGHGLVNMEARAKAAGGSFALQSAPGNGTRIQVKIPLK